VARMTELLLAAGPLQRVLEVGTGSGYQTAILAQLVGKIFSVERIKPLQLKARQRLRTLRLSNIQLSHSDGGMGWEQHAPYDAILATAAPEEIPRELLSQLAVGGRMVIPVGVDTQHLQLVVRTPAGFEITSVDEVRFVPLRSGLVR
jgi:protein-L-isoaspartate(D-aspartate) O-methyltransferase